MRDQHAPDEEFVARLESQIGREVRRRNRASAVPRSPWRSRATLALAAVTLILVSMAAGAAATVAAYEAQDTQRREMLTSGIARQIDLARQRLALVRAEQSDAERRVAVGVVPQESLLEGRIKIAEAQAALSSLELQLEEVRVTGRDPMKQMSAPLVSGRDFVGDRLKIDQTVPEAALQVEQSRLEQVEKRFSVGMADPTEVDMARARRAELEAAVAAGRARLEIRRRFLAGQMDAVETELRLLERDAELRQQTVKPQVALALKQLQSAQGKAEVGIGQRVDVAQAQLKLQELQTEMAKAELDLQLVRQKINGRKREQ